MKKLNKDSYHLEVMKKKLNTRYNPFTNQYEVYEEDLDDLGLVRVAHHFEEHGDAVNCKRTMKKHLKLFNLLDEELVEV